MSQEKQPSRLIFKMHGKAAPPTSDEERLRAAREKAAEYRNPQPPTDEDVDGTRAIEEWADIVTKRIDEAMRRGDFENLPGRGKPMPIEKDPFVPEDMQMAHAILKKNDMTPDWIAERKEMLRAVENWREQFQRIVGEAHSAWIAASSDARRIQIRESWARWLARWEEEIRELNRRIGIFNIKQPIEHLEVFKLKLDDELRKVGMARSLDK
jgi:DnaJ family protein C protein 28